MAAAGSAHTVLLRSDGAAVACGSSGLGQCNLPALDGGLTYTQVSAGGAHTVLLKSDGTAVACGSNGLGQCNLPALDGGLTYAQVAAGGSHTVLLRSDGTAVACGDNYDGRCNLPALDEGLTYGLLALVLQASFDGTSLHFVTLTGEELYLMEATGAERLADLQAQLLHEIGRTHSRVDVVLPDGTLLRRILSEDPLALLGTHICV